MANEPVTQIVIPSRLTDVPRVQREILARVAKHNYPDKFRFAVRLAVDEALVNAIRHGNQEDPTKNVTVEYSVTDDRVKIIVTDEGSGFNPRKLPDPTLEENLTQPHGRGVMLMNAYMTDVSYNRTGNRVTLTKVRGCPLPIG